MVHILLLEEAEKVIEFMQMLAEMEVAHYLTEEQPKPEDDQGVNSNKE